MGMDSLLQFLAPLGGGLAAYVAVRADLAALKARADAAEKRMDGQEHELGVLRQWLHSIRGDL